MHCSVRRGCSRRCSWPRGSPPLATTQIGDCAAVRRRSAILRMAPIVAGDIEMLLATRAALWAEVPGHRMATH